MSKKLLRRRIRGSGGGDQPQQHIPSEDPNTLRSRAYVRILDLLCEGPIEGLVSGSRSILLDETPLRDPAVGDVNVANGRVQTTEVNRDNFANVEWVERTGTQDQDYIEDLTQVENEVAVGVEFRADTPIVRQISNPNVERLKVRIMLPALQSTDTTKGDIRGTSVRIKISVQPSGGVYATIFDTTITGKASNRYERGFKVPLDGDAPWNVKLERVSADNTSAAVQDKTYFQSYTEVIDAKLRYPNSAMIGIRFDSQQFQNIPRRAYEIKGLKIKVPSNYDPETREYDGVWDGTFQTLWSDNPAWVFYDLCTAARYGLGAFLPEAQVDKWALYEIAQYCDELVPDGLGGTEPRFTCNLVLNDRAEAYTVMQSLASVFRGMIYWSSGAITATQDAPQDAAHLFTPANVVDGKFQYQGASLKTRHTVALVSWNDPADLYKLKVEYVEDQDAIAAFGIQQTEIAAFGCTSRGQAHRLGKWLLYTEQYEAETVSFQTGLEGIVNRPGQIIKIADPVRAGVRRGGRISAATAAQVTVDADIAYSVGGNTMSVMLADGTVEERTAIGVAGRVITVQPAFSEAPPPHSIWMLRSEDVDAQTFRVLGVKEEANSIYTITALRHDPSKFDFVEQDLALEPRSISALRYMPDPPSNLTVTEALYQSGADVKAKVTISWDRVVNASSYVVRYQYNNDNFVELKETQFNEQEVLDASPGTYLFQVVAVNSVGKRSLPSELIAETFGKTAPPSGVGGFSMIPNAGQAYLTWQQSSDLDVLVGGQVRIRHSPRTEDQAWKDAIDIIPAVSGNATSALAPLLGGTYMAKFVDSSGNYSVEETIIVTTVPYGLALNVVATETEHPEFLGTKTDMTVDESNGALVLASDILVDDYPDIDDTISWDFPGGIVASGSYDFENTIDLQGVWPFRIYSEIDLEAFDIGNVIDNRVELIDTWTDIDGDSVDDVNAELFVRTTEDDPSGAPVWTEWKRVSAGAYLARGIQFQLQCTSGSEFHNLYIKGLEVTIDLEDRAYNFGPFISGLGATYRVDFSEEFFEAPSVTITANNMASGDFFVITNSDETGFDIVFKNSSNTIVSRNFSGIAKGYGRKVA